MAFKEGAAAPLIARKFKVVKVNVGRFDRNVDVAEAYALPLKRGIPAVVVLSDQGKVVHVTRTGELANARKMGDKGIYEFFNTVVLANRLVAVASANDTLDTKIDQDYGSIWSNKFSAPATIMVKLQR